MKIPTRIDKATSSSPSRYMMNAVEVAHGFAFATDGRMAAVVPVTDPPAEPVRIPSSVFVGLTLNKTDFTITDGHITGPTGRVAPIPSDYRPTPPVADLFPPVTRDGDEWRVGGEPATAVSLNASMLADLAKAIDNDRQVVTLLIRNTQKPVVVLGSVGVGIQMPCNPGPHTEARTTLDNFRRSPSP